MQRPAWGRLSLTNALRRLTRYFREKTGDSMKMIISKRGRTDYDIVSERQLSAQVLTALYKAARDNPLVDGYFWYSLPRTGKSAGNLGHGMFDAAGNPSLRLLCFRRCDRRPF